MITGGVVFLGSYVVEKLKEKGCRNIFIPRKEDYDLTKEAIIIALFKNTIALTKV